MVKPTIRKPKLGPMTISPKDCAHVMCRNRGMCIGGPGRCVKANLQTTPKGSQKKVAKVIKTMNIVRKPSPPAQPDRFSFEYKADHWMLVTFDGRQVLRVQARDEYQREVIRMALAYGTNDIRRTS